MKKAEGLSNIFIHDILNNRAVNYIGVFSANNIIVTQRKVITLVCNLSDYKQPGTHFVAIQIDKIKKIAEYYDPYGLPCYNASILKYICKYVEHIHYANRQVQHIYSDYCGIHCMAFILSKNIDVSFTEFIGMYKNTKLHNNDDIALEFVISML